MERIYLDNAAATPLDRRVLTAMMPYLTEQYGNPSSLHYYGQQARAAIQRAREQVGHCLGLKGDTIIFTGGGTEADNLAILGYLRANHPQGGHIITTAVEHQAVLNTFRYLGQHGYDVTILPVDKKGRLHLKTFEEALRADTVLVSVMYANNETGVIQPIDKIAALTRAYGITLHVDAVQAFGYLPVQPLTSGIDMLTLCSHKIYGPKGVGALYVRKNISLVPAVYGGPQEHRLRAGTENVAAIVGFGEAAALLEKERAERGKQAKALKKIMYDQLFRAPNLFHLNGTLTGALPNILNFSVNGTTSDLLLIALDMAGIAVSAGSACAAGALEASHVLKAMHMEEKWLNSSIRVSFGKDTSVEDCVRAGKIILAMAQRLTNQEERHE